MKKHISTRLWLASMLRVEHRIPICHATKDSVFTTRVTWSSIFRSFFFCHLTKRASQEEVRWRVIAIAACDLVVVEVEGVVRVQEVCVVRECIPFKKAKDATRCEYRWHSLDTHSLDTHTPCLKHKAAVSRSWMKWCTPVLLRRTHSLHDNVQWLNKE